jgi:hypothetical protein
VPIIGRAEFRESLWTSDMEVARTLAAFRDEEVAIEFEKAKEVLCQQRGASLQLDELTPEEEQYVRERVRAHVLEEDDTRPSALTLATVSARSPPSSRWCRATR